MTGLPGPPLRIAVLGDFDGAHTRRWLRVFIERGHDVHAISYYAPHADLPGVTLHALSDTRRARSTTNTSSSSGSIVPRSLLRLVHALRYRRVGLRRVLDEIRPNVFHAHYVTEHGFYGVTAGFHPYVVSAWGSDLFVDARSWPNRQILRYALRHADLVTANDPALASRAVELGVAQDNIAVIRLGIDRLFLDGAASINARADATPPTIISTRALEPLYNVDFVLRAFAQMHSRIPDARLLIAGQGSQRAQLEALAHELRVGDAVRFMGQLAPEALRDTLAGAHVYVSVASSDSLSLSTREAMAAGAYPVVSDLPSLGDWLATPATGLRVPVRNVTALADALYDSLQDRERRRAAVETNRARVEAEGLLEPNMLEMERLYYRLAAARSS